MLKVIFLLGEPGVGKSTLMEQVMNYLGDSNLLKIKTLKYHEFKEAKTIVLGQYGDGQSFPGTDRLSMSVQPIASKVLTKWSKDDDRKGWTILIEGDRLGNQSFIGAIQSLPVKLKIFALVASDEIKEFRHKDRGDTQNDVWLKGRLTKVKNLLEAFEDVIVILPNENRDQLRNNCARILRNITSRKERK
jgi:hypothetical protein